MQDVGSCFSQRILLLSTAKNTSFVRRSGSCPACIDLLVGAQDQNAVDCKPHASCQCTDQHRVAHCRSIVPWDPGELLWFNLGLVHPSAFTELREHRCFGPVRKMNLLKMFGRLFPLSSTLVPKRNIPSDPEIQQDAHLMESRMPALTALLACGLVRGWGFGIIFHGAGLTFELFMIQNFESTRGHQTRRKGYKSLRSRRNNSNLASCSELRKTSLAQLAQHARPTLFLRRSRPLTHKFPPDFAPSVSDCRSPRNGWIQNFS
eukprot:2223785-Rhodomonas_salina.2